MINKIKGFCGQAHIWILLISIATTGIGLGVVWGNLTAKVDALRESILRERAQQLDWNAAEHRTNDSHRDRMNDLQKQMFDLLKEIRDK